MIRLREIGKAPRKATAKRKAKSEAWQKKVEERKAKRQKNTSQDVTSHGVSSQEVADTGSAASDTAQATVRPQAGAPARVQRVCGVLPPEGWENHCWQWERKQEGWHCVSDQLFFEEHNRLWHYSEMWSCYVHVSYLVISTLGTHRRPTEAVTRQAPTSRMSDRFLGEPDRMNYNRTYSSDSSICFRPTLLPWRRTAGGIGLIHGSAASSGYQARNAETDQPPEHLGQAVSLTPMNNEPPAMEVHYSTEYIGPGALPVVEGPLPAEEDWDTNDSFSD